MNQIDSFEFVASVETLRKYLEEKSIPESLLAPFQALTKPILEEAGQKSISVYLHSADEAREVRNYFAHALAKALIEHVPSVVLVDVDFLQAGMSGIVPHKDALGFLDYLLYGSSLGVVTQEAPQGVSVIGVGSFPMQKKMPIAAEAFGEAARRLASQSRLAIFCGPEEDDEGNIHPAAEIVDLPIHVRYASRFPVGGIDPFEEKLSARIEARLMSVRISSSGAAVLAAEESAQTLADEKKQLARGEEPESDRESVEITAGRTGAPDSEETREAGDDAGAKEAVGSGVAKETGVDTVEETPQAVEFTGLPFEKKGGGSLFPKIVTFLVGGFLIVFLVWWFVLTDRVQKTGEDLDQVAGVDAAAVGDEASAPDASAQPGDSREQTDDEGQALQAEEPSGGVTDEVVAQESPRADETGDQRTAGEGETVARPDVREEETPVERETSAEEQPVRPAEETAFKGELRIAEDFTEFAGQYLVHVSSFRSLDRAKEDGRYLVGENFAACIIPADLGEKGLWYRVYGGPVKTRNEAIELKKKLDVLSRVKFTRITRAPGF